jgi:hypothetical protein
MRVGECQLRGCRESCGLHAQQSGRLVASSKRKQREMGSIPVSCPTATVRSDRVQAPFRWAASGVSGWAQIASLFMRWSGALCTRPGKSTVSEQADEGFPGNWSAGLSEIQQACWALMRGARWLVPFLSTNAAS